LAERKLWDISINHIGTGYAVGHDDYTGYNLNSMIAGPGQSIDATNETGLHVEWDQDNHYSTWALRNSVLCNGVEAWYQDASGAGSVNSYSADLSAHDGTMIEVEFLYEGDYANEWSIDDIDLRAPDGGGGGFNLSVANLVAGATTTLSLANANAGGVCIIAYSVYGGGPTNTPVGTVDLSMPIRQLPAVTADSAGAASVSASVPPHVGGMNVWIQAVDLGVAGAPVLSNSLAETVG